jgi:uncharacterized protein
VKRVVADTNVLVSAIQFGGKPKQLLDLAVDGHIDLAISEAILEETLRVLRDKFHRTPDDRILECAIAADAEVIVSGDQHLLALGSFKGIPIQRVGEFLAAFQERRRVGS